MQVATISNVHFVSVVTVQSGVASPMCPGGILLA